MGSLRPPFSNARWTLLLLSLVWAGWILGDQCDPHYLYILLGLATATVTIILWVNHLRVASAPLGEKLYEIAAGGLYDLGVFILILAGIMVFSAFVQGTADCYSPRMRVNAMRVYADGLQMEVSERARKQGTLLGSGIGSAVDQSWPIDEGHISPNGTITLTSSDPAAILVLTPTMQAGEVTWGCTGFPLALLPASCRKLPIFP